MTKNPDFHSNLDPTDIAMIEILQDDGRISVSELGRKVGLSQPATSERLKRLEDRGIIKAYQAVVDPASVGLGMMAIIRLRTTHEHIKACLKLFAEMPQVIEALRLTGEDCFHLKVIVPSPAHLEGIVDAIARYGSVTTAIVLRSEKPKRIGRELIGKR
ncbi:Lrp/AsnC family transcriptional regulator [Neorhizobium galegae]|uniref:Lrp/AsnC family transcriptional regulator n=1 Tax=Neorhizobium galegae TaxID=399 RepID=UPI0006225F60|nr:Lrp/AsnC family transcriptional regulator [Neorhizobium galegae]CDZ30302.1 Transcriptional regulator, AsnC family [Neorhizobium galegae bv. officinalis]KAA9386353.1 Lrp/AsnC family transcriptional regulator [Neorhizobium galegae]KAB1112793.1 Lrp/AsnC family transcriptional regulator [Neorhizobium galegae]MCM2501386.1 Lrp/AsnC family transcriptional regulator [Neorhizobium galegae]MCQ1764569.1 Lrp/AsnC family transcriptional regulator [Neorhizobium galegae]